LFSFNIENSSATSCSKYGNNTYCDDGTSYSQYGNNVYGSDGTSYSQYGNNVYGSDGTSYSTYGSNTYGNDGTSYSTYGNNTYGSDGSSYSQYGNTIYGNGGKMIDIGDDDDLSQNKYYDSTTYDSNDRKTIDVGDNCPLNSSYDSLSSSCKCNYGYAVSGSICIYKGSDDLDTGKVPSYFPSQQNEPEAYIIPPITSGEDVDNFDSIPRLDVNSNKTKANQNVPTENLKIEKNGKNFVWWNPLTWWGYFFNKSTPSDNSIKAEPIKLIKQETLPASFEWKEYSSDDGKFTALFPGEVSHDDWMDNATMKKLGWDNISKIDTFDVKTSDDEHFSVWFHYYVNQNDTIDKATLKASLYNLLNLMKDYKLTFTDYSKHGKYDALDYLIFNEREDKYEKGKFIAVKQNVYQIFVDYKGENFNDADINKFFASFYTQ
jgi:hypothetical protein